MEIPDKLFFKIGEVCELVGVQAHVLRYWETEFSMLSPQKNRSGQRSYRKKDVETAIRIKQLLYDDMYTIAGARKRLNAELREARAAKPANGSLSADFIHDSEAPTLFDNLHFDSGPAPAGLKIDKDTGEALNNVIARIKELQAELSADPFAEMPPEDVV